MKKYYIANVYENRWDVYENEALMGSIIVKSGCREDAENMAKSTFGVKADFEKSNTSDENEMGKHVRDFTDACHENSLEELKAITASDEKPCLPDMEEWGLTGGEWVEAIFTAIKEMEAR